MFSDNFAVVDGGGAAAGVVAVAGAEVLFSSESEDPLDDAFELVGFWFRQVP